MSHLDGKQVLIVDDHPFMLATLKAALRAVARFTVTEAADGEGALQAVRRMRPDVVLCDVSMAPMTGLEFLEHVRNDENPRVRDTPVVLVTVDQDKTTVLHAARLKVQGYLVKPVSPQAIKNRLLTIFPAP